MTMRGNRPEPKVYTIQGTVLNWYYPSVNQSTGKVRPGKFVIKQSEPLIKDGPEDLELVIFGRRDKERETATTELSRVVTDLGLESIKGAVINARVTYQGLNEFTEAKLPQYRPFPAEPQEDWIISIVKPASQNQAPQIQTNGTQAPAGAPVIEGAARGNAITASNDMILRLWSLLGRQPTVEELESHIKLLHIGKDLILQLREPSADEPQADENPTEFSLE